MRMAMDVYLRSATQRVRVHMMEVECWRSLNTEGGVSTRRMSLDVDALSQRPDVVIPFCCYVDIGVNTSVQKYPTQVAVLFWDGVPCRGSISRCVLTRKMQSG
jgi:hypothetical protein